MLNLISDANWIRNIYYQNIRGLNGEIRPSSNNGVESHHSSLSLNQFNIVIGVNGSGKSSLLDAISSVSTPSKWLSLQREFLLNGEPSKLIIDTELHSIEFNVFNKDMLDDPSMHKIELEVSGRKSKIKKHSMLFNNHVDFINERNMSVSNDIINICDFSEQDVKKLIDKDFVGELDKVSDHLCGVGTYLGIRGEEKRPSFFIHEDKSISVYLELDDSVPNKVRPELLPSGWYAYGLITSFLLKKRNATCLFDEPDVHMHPKLRKLLIVRMKEIADINNIQLIVSTHSAEWLNESLDRQSKLFRANGKGISEAKVSKQLLDELGYKPSDLLQTDGLIWVEGPSDRIYLLDWLTAYAKLTNNTDAFRRFNFNFSFYGGSTINHFGRGKNLIDILSVNQNSAIIMDNDNEYNHSTKQFKSKNKELIYNTYASENETFCWITHGYTIEEYLPKGFLNKYFETDELNILRKIKSKSKVNIAIEFTKNESSVELLKKNKVLYEQVEMLFEKITSWCA